VSGATWVFDSNDGPSSGKMDPKDSNVEAFLDDFDEETATLRAEKPPSDRETNAPAPALPPPPPTLVETKPLDSGYE
jgi:hypothetical protein